MQSPLPGEILSTFLIQCRSQQRAESSFSFGLLQEVSNDA